MIITSTHKWLLTIRAGWLVVIVDLQPIPVVWSVIKEGLAMTFDEVSFPSVQVDMHLMFLCDSTLWWLY